MSHAFILIAAIVSVADSLQLSNPVEEGNKSVEKKFNNIWDELHGFVDNAFASADAVRRTVNSMEEKLRKPDVEPVHWAETAKQRCHPAGHRVEVQSATTPESCKKACADSSECFAANFYWNTRTCYKCPAGFQKKISGASTMWQKADDQANDQAPSQNKTDEHLADTIDHEGKRDNTEVLESDSKESKKPRVAILLVGLMRDWDTSNWVKLFMSNMVEPNNADIIIHTDAGAIVEDDPRAKFYNRGACGCPKELRKSLGSALKVVVEQDSPDESAEAKPRNQFFHLEKAFEAMVEYEKKKGF